MSAYAALLSLQQILVRLLYPQSMFIHGGAQLKILLKKANLLLNFLDYSSSTYKEEIQISDLETKIRDAARKAEDLVEHWILNSDFSLLPHNSIELSIYVFSLCLAIIAVIILEPYLEVITVWILFEVTLCMMNAAIVYRRMHCLYVFPALNGPEELRRVLYDFNMIVKEVNRIKEATSAHEALISLRQIMDAIPGDRGHLRSLHEKVRFLLDFLGNASTAYMSTQNLDAAIKHAVSKAKKALFEFQHPSKFSLHLGLKRLLLDPIIMIHLSTSIIIRVIMYTMEKDLRDKVSLHVITTLGPIGITFASCVPSVVLAAKHYSGAPKNRHLAHVLDDFSIIVTDAIKIRDAAYGNHPSNLPPAAAASSRQDLGGTGKDVVVGLESDLIEINTRLLQHSSNRQLVSIVGMGGIGKTTLARQVYKDPNIVTHFDVRAWVTVSQEYSLRHVLLCLLDSADMLTEEEKREDSDEKLTLYLHQYLTSRRYLIVIDDVWHTEIWDFLSRFFPDNDNGSRVLLTSRLQDVARYPDRDSPLHHMQCLSEDDSWYLLREKAFGEEGCPLELESIGREIATSCRGLPLAIVVTGGLLYKDIKIEMWRDVAEKIKKSELPDIKDQCLEILGLSYNHLPHHLRPCFLYMAVLPRDCEIPISRLINLWVAERFLEPCTSKTIEDVGEGYLKDLIDRNLILVCKKTCNGKMRTCSMHDLLRDVCVQNSRKEKFLHVMNSEGKVTADESPCRLSIHPDALHVDAKLGYVRSLLCIASKSIEYPSSFYLGFVYLRVLDVLEVHFGEFPHQITKLFRLRYLALNYDGPLPPSILNLKELLTIVHHCCSFRKYPCLSWVIWRMPNLRHIYVKPGCYLVNPIGYYRFLPKVGFLRNLQTLVGIRNFKWSKGIIKRIPNLKKLVISYDVDWSTYQLETLVYLHQLESLKINIQYDDVGSTISSHDPPKLAFPQKLKKLSLSGCRIPWTSMTTAIGALPNLEALKLRREACSGSLWETVEEEFPKLMFLLLEEMSFTRWETGAAHFPRLQRLIIRSCGMLEEIPCTIGDIPTLEMIELVDCHPCAVASAKEIQQEQESMGNEDLKFHI